VFYSGASEAPGYLRVLPKRKTGCAAALSCKIEYRGLNFPVSLNHTSSSYARKTTMTSSVSDKSESASHPKQDRHIVIIGGGIIGVCTAYYLLKHARSPEGPEVKVTLVETHVVAGCASGKAGGFIALDWHSPATASLGRLSWNLFADLAREYDGAQKWGFRPMGAVGYTMLSAKATKNRSSESELELVTSPKVEESEMRPRPSPREGKVDDSWLNQDVEWSILGSEGTTAQVYFVSTARRSVDC
jgi:hypothetical protein